MFDNRLGGMAERFNATVLKEVPLDSLRTPKRSTKQTARISIPKQLGSEVRSLFVSRIGTSSYAETVTHVTFSCHRLLQLREKVPIL